MDLRDAEDFMSANELMLKQNKMGIIKDKVNSLKKDPWYKKLRRWLKFKLWILKHELNKSE